MTKRLTIALVAVALFVLMAVMPVSAQPLWANGTVINQGATIFIGEQGLNVTHAMNQAWYRSLPPEGTIVGTPFQNNTFPNLTAIGWWGSAVDLYTTFPSKTIDLGVNRRYAQMTVAPADFVGYTGNWYLLNPNGTRPIGNNGDASMVFAVADPALDIKIWDFNQNADVTGSSVPQGELLGFRIDTNMYPAVDTRYRSNVVDDSITGVWAVPYTYGDVATNNLLYNQTSGVWINGTYSILTNPNQPCCPIYANVYAERFYNFTGSGAWMTWSDGPFGCDKAMSYVNTLETPAPAISPWFWNDTKGWLYDNYSESVANVGSTLDIHSVLAGWNWNDNDYCMYGQYLSLIHI